MSHPFPGPTYQVECFYEAVTLLPHIFSRIYRIFPFFLSSRCALWSRIKALQQQLSICCPCERGESFSLRWILGWQSHMQANAHTHSHRRHTGAQESKHKHKRTCTQIPVDIEVDALGHYRSFREMNTSTPTPLRRLLVSPLPADLCASRACMSFYFWKSIARMSFVCHLSFKCQTWRKNRIANTCASLSRAP